MDGSWLWNQSARTSVEAGHSSFLGAVVTLAPLGFGLDLTALFARLDLMEERIMASAAEQINALKGKVDAQGDVLVDIASDFAAFKTAMEAERENLTVTGQEALDAANASLDSNAERLSGLDTAVGDADGSDVPPVEEPEVPAEPVV